MKNKISSIKILLTSIIGAVLSFSSGYLGWKMQLLIVFNIYFIIGLSVFNKNNNFKKNLLIQVFLTLPFFILYGINAISKSYYHIYPIVFIPILSILFTFSIKSIFKYKVALTTSIIISLLCYIGMANWLSYSLGRTITSYNYLPEFKVVTSENKPFKFDDNKIYLLNVWSTACAPCIEKFPDYEQLANRYKKDSIIEIVTLSLPLTKDYEKSLKFTKKYSFKALLATQDESWQKLQTNKVPLYIVIGKNQKIVYTGVLNSKWYEFYNNIHGILKKEKHTYKTELYTTALLSNINY